MRPNEKDSRGSHWTHRLFVDNAHLYLPFLEAAVSRADAEVGVMVDRFNELGIPPDARVLDAGCGIGRHSVPLASRGYEVTGFDLSPLYLEEARRAAGAAGVNLRLIQEDSRELGHVLRDEAPFQAVVNMFTSHGYYREGADLRFFRDLHSLAVPGAALVIETLNRDYILRNFQPLGVVEAGGIEQHDHRRLNLETSCLENVWTFYEKSDDGLRLRLRLEFDLRMYSLHELRELLGRAGWEPVSSFTREGDGTDTSPVKPDSFRMWIVARRV